MFKAPSILTSFNQNKIIFNVLLTKMCNVIVEI